MDRPAGGASPGGSESGSGGGYSAAASAITRSVPSKVETMSSVAESTLSTVAHTAGEALDPIRFR
jgi:hypothetical protein